MKSLKGYNIIIIVLVVFLSYSCTKTKLGNYRLTIDGTIYSIERNAYCCDTTGIYTIANYHTESEIKITNVGNSNIEIDGNIWRKDGKSIIFEYSYNSNNQTGHALGGSDRYTESYNGIIQTNKLINGEYHKQYFSFVNSGKTYKSIIHANFSIVRN